MLIAKTDKASELSELPQSSTTCLIVVWVALLHLLVTHFVTFCHQFITVSWTKLVA